MKHWRMVWALLMAWPLSPATAQPEPRTLATVVVDPPAGLGAGFVRASRHLLARPDGSVDATIAWEAEESGSKAPTKVELVRIGKDAALLKEVTLATGQELGGEPRGPFQMASGEMVVYVFSDEPQNSYGSLLHLSAEGDRLKTMRLIFQPPPEVLKHYPKMEYAFSLAFDLRDGSVIVGGNGSCPFSSWWGRLAHNGTRVADSGSIKQGVPCDVAAGRAEPDGGFSLVVAEVNWKDGGTADLWLHRYDARGTRTLYRKLVDHTVGPAAFYGDEIVVFGWKDSQLRVFDAKGGPIRQLPWDGQTIWRLDADPKGYLMIVDDNDEKAQIFRNRVVRCDRNGVVLWRSSKGHFIDAVLAPDGSVWTVARTPPGGSNGKWTFQRFADP
ncbi:MAG TPA: hypothetical protein VMI56_11930 [Reyranella sp.]|nr:hypothetical protein [Reyranella sp.]